MAEGLLKAHYQLLKEYLADVLPQARDKGTSSAMARVSRLPQEQFLDMSTDLHDELDRRLNDSDMPFLAVRTDLPQKRNQARQKMATLPEAKFMDLAVEVFLEIERRIPGLGDDARNSISQRSERSQRTDTRDRNDSRAGNERYNGRSDNRNESRTRSERSERPTERARSGNRENSARNEPIADRRRERERRDRSREPVPRYGNETPSGPSQEEHDKIVSDYEYKITVLEKKLRTQYESEQELVKQLEELTVIKEERRDLKNELEKTRKETEKLKTEIDTLKKDNKTLKAEHEKSMTQVQELKKTVADLESSASSLKQVSEENKTLKETIKRMEGDSAAFLKDIQSLKDKLRTAEAQRESLGRQKESSPKTVTESPKKSEPAPRTFSEAKFNPGFEKYQQSAQELITAAKSNTSSAVLGPMKQVLLACREVTESSEAIEDDQTVSEEDKDQLFEIKSSLSNTLTSLMQATKEHSANSSVATQKAIEQEVQKLSFCISDLFELMKIIESSGPGSRATLSKRDTLKSTAQEPLPPLDLPGLFEYLDEQIALVKQANEDLSAALKRGKPINDFVSDIAQFLDNIVYETQGTIDIETSLSDNILRDCDDILNILNEIREEVLDFGDAVSKGDKNAKSQLIKSSGEILKHAKDLVQVLGG